MTRLTGIAVVLMLLMVVGIFAAGCAKKKVVDETKTLMPVQTPQMDEEIADTDDEEPTDTEEAALTYVCAACGETSDEPGKCPKCGEYMAADTEAAVEYYCAMCDGGAQDEPGCCAMCGEDCALVARLVTDDAADDDDAAATDDEGSEDDDEDGDDEDDDETA